MDKRYITVGDDKRVSGYMGINKNMTIIIGSVVHIDAPKT